MGCGHEGRTLGCGDENWRYLKGTGFMFIGNWDDVATSEVGLDEFIGHLWSSS